MIIAAAAPNNLQSAISHIYKYNYILHVSPLKCHPAARILDPRLRLDERQPIGRVRRQQSHAVAFVQRQRHVGQVAKHEDDLLAGRLGALDHLECGARREDGLDRSDQHHADHHDGEDGNGIAGHVHDEQVHWDLYSKQSNKLS